MPKKFPSGSLRSEDSLDSYITHHKDILIIFDKNTEFDILELKEVNGLYIINLMQL